MYSPSPARFDQPARTCRLKLSALYCVSTKTRRSPEFTQFDRVMSMMRYTAPNGTAGLARSRVSGHSRSPWPPASSTTIASRMSSMVVAHISAHLAFHRPRHFPASPIRFQDSHPGGFWHPSALDPRGLCNKDYLTLHAKLTKRVAIDRPSQGCKTFKNQACMSAARLGFRGMSDITPIGTRHSLRRHAILLAVETGI